MYTGDYIEKKIISKTLEKKLAKMSEGISIYYIYIGILAWYILYIYIIYTYII